MKTENNKLIAEFMGWESFNQFSMIAPKSEEDCWAFEDMKFHNDWNWLMEVVEKIEEMADWSLELLTTDKKEYQMLIPLSNTNVIVETKIEAVYNACVEFIKWYNKNAVKS